MNQTPFIMHLLYDIVLHITMLFMFPYFLFKAIYRGKYRSGISERFGFIRGEKLSPLSGNHVVWFHAVSVGETKAVLPFLRLFKKRHPNVKVVFSTVTQTGNRVASKEGAGLIDALIYFPLDLSWVVRRVVGRIKPRLFVVVEKELWPNHIRILNENSIPIIVANGTISERSFRRYNKFLFFFKTIFSGISYYCAITDEDARMAIKLGMDEKNTIAAGNLKFDMEPAHLDEMKKEELKNALTIEASDMVIVAGSTHEGEEEIMLDAFKTLKKGFPNLKLVVAPRHPERFGEVRSIVKAGGFSFKTRSDGDRASKEVVVLDTLGELSTVYSFSTVSFVGGTLVDAGGHNLLEPAFFGVPVVYGPHLRGYLYMAELLEKEGASTRVDKDTIAAVIEKILNDPSLRLRMGRAGEKVVLANRGAVERTLELIGRFMKSDECESI